MSGKVSARGPLSRPLLDAQAATWHRRRPIPPVTGTARAAAPLALGGASLRVQSSCQVVPPAPLRAPAAPRMQLTQLLTFRGIDVLLLLNQRLTNKEIAHSLGISPDTVRQHRSISSASWALITGARRSCRQTPWDSRPN